MVASVTHLAAKEPTQVLIEISTPEGKPTGLLHDSAITCENLYTVEKRNCNVTDRLSDDRVDYALRASLAL